MRLDDFGQSDNINDRRGQGGPAMGGGNAFLLVYLFRFIFNRFGIGGVVVAGGGLFLLSSLGLNPLGGQGPQPRTYDTKYDQLVGAVLLSTERVFAQMFEEEGLGVYPEPTLNLFAGGVRTAGCGSASSAVGPFYCPGVSGHRVTSLRPM